MINALREKKHQLVSGALVASLLSLTACSSNANTQAAAPPGTATGVTSANSSGTTSTPATGTPIKLGMLSPKGAQFYNTPDELAAVKAAIASINAAGGVKGQPLQLDWCNEGNDPNKAAACARSFVTNHDVATVASITITNPDAVTSVLAAGGIAQVDLSPLTTTEFASKSNFPYDGGGPWETAGAVGAAIKTQGARKILVVRQDLPQSLTAHALAAQVVQHLGAQIANDVLLPPTAIPDYSTYAQKIISSGADLAVLPLPKDQAIGIINATRQLGSQLKFATEAGAFADADLAQLGANADGVLIFAPTPWISDGADYPGVNDFVASMKAEQGRGDSDADVSKARPFALMDWIAVHNVAQVMTNVLEAKQPLTAASFLQAFSQAKDLAPAGAAKTPWTPSTFQTVVPGYANVSNTEGYLLMVKDGKQVLASKDPYDVLSFLS